jgi:hypothetical protein
MTVIPLPRHGQWVGDARGEGRSVRVTAHDEAGLLNLSLWRHGACVGTVRLLPDDVATLMSGLAEGLAQMARAVPVDERRSEDRLQELERRLAALEERRPEPRASFAPRVALTGWVRSAIGYRPRGR